MKVGILDIGSGNLRSLAKAVERAGEEAGIPADVRIIANAEETAAMERLLLPGVGAFAHAMDGLERQTGLRAALEEAVFERKRPFLGVCVGMHLLLERGLEHGDRRGLGWFAGTVGPLQPGDGLRVPHMGWNELRVCGDAPHPVFAPLGATASPHAYFAHSYHADLTDTDCLLAATDYGHLIAAAIGRGNILGVQFHPEKSQRLGLEILAAFLRWEPTATPSGVGASRKKNASFGTAVQQGTAQKGGWTAACRRGKSFGMPVQRAVTKRGASLTKAMRLSCRGRQVIPKKGGWVGKMKGGLGGLPPKSIRTSMHNVGWAGKNMGGVGGFAPHMQNSPSANDGKHDTLPEAKTT